MPNAFRLIDLARSIVSDVNRLLRTSRPPLLHQLQLTDSAQSITGNIREAYGRRLGPERNQFFRYALGSAEETDEHLFSNFDAGRLKESVFWRLHNRLVVLRKMIEQLMRSKRDRSLGP